MAPVVGTDDGVANHNVVFIGTSLDTHLAMIVSDSDIVSDFKKKIVFEHRQLFPVIGDVKIESLKVKKRGNFYHLSDSMLVKSAFDASKRNWFVSADASRLEQSDGVQHLGKHKAGDQLALPWVTHSPSIEGHDNHGSPSVHSKTVPFLIQKVLNAEQLTSGDSSKEASKNVEEDRSGYDKQLDNVPQQKLYVVNTDINSNKRTRDAHNESSPKGAFGLGPSVKKKRKTQRVKSDVKASEENIALTDVTDKVNDRGASINNENSIEHTTKGKDSSDENNRTNKGENGSAIAQVATEVPSIEVVGSENVGGVAMIVENSSHQEMSTAISQKEKDNELLQKPAMENEIHSSLMRTTDSENDAAGVTAAGHLKRSTKHKAAEKEVFSTSFIKKLHNTNEDAIESASQQDVKSHNQECAGNQIDKYKDDSEVSLKQKPELKLPGRKKGTMGCENIGEGKRKKIKKLFKHADKLVGDIFSTVPALVTDERKMNGDSEKTIDADSLVRDDVIGKEMEVSVENMEEKSRKEFTDANDVTIVANEENLLPHSESLMNNDAEISTTRKNTGQVSAQGILDNLKKQNEKTDDTTKKKTRKKTKKPSGRNKDESITKHANGGIFENVKEGEDGLPDAVRKDDDMSLTVLASVIGERKMEKVSEITLIDAKRGDDVIEKEVEISVENSRKEFTDTNDVVTVTNEENVLPHSESRMSNDAEITTGKNISEVNTQGILDNPEKQNETDDTTKKKRKRKAKKSATRNEDESTTKHANHDISDNSKGGESSLADADRKEGDKVKEKEAPLYYEGLVGEANKNNKSQDLPSRHQSTEVELESMKSQIIDHHHLPEATLKNMTASEVSNFNNEVDASEDSSHELDFGDYFTCARQLKKIASIDNSKCMKKTKDDSRNDRSQKLVSKNVNNKVSTDILKNPSITNIDNIKTPKRTKKIDAQKTNKQQSNVGQTKVKTVKKKSVNSSQQVKSLLNTPGTIFGDDSDDDATANSDSSTRTPSRDSSSSSGESASSMDSRRNRSHARKGQEGAGKNNKNKQSKPKEISIVDRFRSSSSFKKLKVNASSRLEDSESQPVEFVPDSQPMGKR